MFAELSSQPLRNFAEKLSSIIDRLADEPSDAAVARGITTMTIDLRTLALTRFAVSLDRLSRRIWTIAEQPAESQAALLQFVSDELARIALEASELTRPAELRQSDEGPLAGVGHCP